MTQGVAYRAMEDACQTAVIHPQPLLGVVRVFDIDPQRNGAETRTSSTLGTGSVAAASVAAHVLQVHRAR